MNCLRAKRLLQLRATKPRHVGVERIAELEHHLASCPACGRLAADLGRTEGALATLTAPDPAPDFLARLLTSVSSATAERPQRHVAFWPGVPLPTGLRRSVAPALCGLLVGIAIGATAFPRMRTVVRTRTLPVEKTRIVRVEVPILRERVVTRYVRVTRADTSRRQGAWAGVRSSGNRSVPFRRTATKTAAAARTFPIRVSTEYSVVEAMAPPVLGAVAQGDGSGGGMLVCPVQRQKVTPIPAEVVTGGRGVRVAYSPNGDAPPPSGGQL